MIHEAFGLDEVMRRQAERLAAAGYLALAVDLFSDGGTLRCLVPTLRAMRKGQGRPFADIQAARSWLAASSDCTGNVGGDRVLHGRRLRAPDRRLRLRGGRRQLRAATP
jgi:carboxymethylenebutenolidase